MMDIRNFAGNAMIILTGMLVIGCTQAESNSEPIPCQTFTVNGVNFEMVQVEGGTFRMGGTGQ